VNPYRALLAGNRNFRLLWFGQIVSQLGDWFNAVAIYSLLLELTGSASSVAWMMIVQLLPMAVVGPIAGVVVDRVNRRRVMIAADILRGCLILVLLFVRQASDVWIIYVVMGAAVSATSFFEPARTSVIPGITRHGELLTANALSSATWSAVLAAGAAAGGAVTALAGRDTAFVVNAASFFASAVLIARTRFDADPPGGQRRPLTLASVTGASDLAEGFRYVRSSRQVTAIILVKAGWGVAGVAILLLTIFGERVFPLGGSAAAGIGLLYAARGVGAGLGPILARFWLGQHPDQMRRAIAPAFFGVALFYVLLGLAPNIWAANLAVVGAHMGGSILWVFSTVLLQMAVVDRFRGRVFAADQALVTLTSVASSYLCGMALDHAGFSPFALARAVGLVLLVPSIGWLAIEKWQRPAELNPP
jgi:MFS family permease